MDPRNHAIDPVTFGKVVAFSLIVLGLLVIGFALGAIPGRSAAAPAEKLPPEWSLLAPMQQVGRDVFVQTIHNDVRGLTCLVFFGAPGIAAYCEHDPAVTP